MPSTVVVEGLLIVAGIVAASVLAGAVINKIGAFDSSFTMAANNQKNILLTKIKIIYATNSEDDKADVWIKNIGASPVTNPETMDVFFGQIGQVQRIPYDTGTTPTWNFTEPIDIWKKQETVEIEIFNDSTFPSNAYSVTVIAPNGVEDEHVFSIP